MPMRPPVHRPSYAKPASDRHQVHDRYRGSAASRGYDRQWEKVRRIKLAEEPLCRHCLERGFVEAAREVHHSIPLRDRPDLRLDMSLLVPLCTPCHSSETAREKGRK